MDWSDEDKIIWTKVKYIVSERVIAEKGWFVVITPNLSRYDVIGQNFARILEDTKSEFGAAVDDATTVSEADSLMWIKISILANMGGLVFAGDPEQALDARDQPVICKDLKTDQDLHSYIEKGTAKWV